MTDQTNVPSPGRANAYVALLGTLLALNLMDRQLLAVVAEPVKREFALTDTQLGLLTGLIFALVFAAASIPIAWAADRVNRVRVLSVCAALWAVFTAFMGAVAGFQQLAIARVGLAIGEAGCGPCAQSLIADYVPSERRASAMAIFAMGAPAGLVVAGVAGGMLTDAFGWRVAFYVLGGVSLLAAAVAAWVLPEPRRRSEPSPLAAEPTPREGMQAGGFRRLARKRAFRNLMFASAFFSIAVYGSLAWGMVYVIRYFDWTAGEAGAVFAPLGAVFGLGGTWVGGRLSDLLKQRDRRWQMWVPAIALIVATPATVVAPFAPTMAVLLVALSAEAFLRSMVLAPGLATLQGLSPNSARARAAATAGVVGVLVGLGLGPTIVGLLSDRLTPLFGADALRYGLVALVIPQLFAAFHYWRAARTLETELID